MMKDYTGKGIEESMMRGLNILHSNDIVCANAEERCARFTVCDFARRDIDHDLGKAGRGGSIMIITHRLAHLCAASQEPLLALPRHGIQCSAMGTKEGPSLGYWS